MHRLHARPHLWRHGLHVIIHHGLLLGCGFAGHHALMLLAHGLHVHLPLAHAAHTAQGAR